MTDVSDLCVVRSVTDWALTVPLILAPCVVRSFSGLVHSPRQFRSSEFINSGTTFGTYCMGDVRSLAVQDDQQICLISTIIV